MLPHMSDQYIEGAAIRMQRHQKREVLAARAEIQKAEKAHKSEKNHFLVKLFKRRQSTPKVPLVQGHQHS